MDAEAVWLNGRIVRGDRARVPVFDRGLLYGDGLFETIRVYQGCPFMLPRHLARLRRSGRAIGIAVAGDTSSWRRAIQRLLAANHLRDGTVRLTVTRGAAAGLVPPSHPRPTTFIQARGLEPGLRTAHHRGVAVCLLPFDRGGGFLLKHKTLAYLPAVLGRRHARRRRVYDGLYVTPEGFVTEATTANLFVCHGNRVRTPAADVLPGIARNLVLELASASGYRVEQQAVPRTFLATATEIFLTSSVVEVLPVVRVGGQRVGTGQPGPLTRSLQRAYSARVARTVCFARTA